MQFPRAAPGTQPRSGSSGVACATACGDSSTVEPEHATLEIRVRFSVTAPSTLAEVPCRAHPSLRSSEEGASHTRGPGGSTLPAATDPEVRGAGSAALNRWGGGARPSSGTGPCPVCRSSHSAAPPMARRSARSCGARHLVMTPASQAGEGEFDPLAPYRRASHFQRGPSRGYRLDPGVLGVQLGARTSSTRSVGSNAPEPRLWKSNREWSRARPLPGAYRKVWCSSRLTSARKERAR